MRRSFLLPALLLLALLLAGCTASTSGPVPDSQLGRLRRVHICTENAARALAAFGFLGVTDGAGWRYLERGIPRLHSPPRSESPAPFPFLNNQDAASFRAFLNHPLDIRPLEG